MKSLILFDIDRTLYDTDQFTEIYRKKFCDALDLPIDQLENIRSKYFKTLQKNTDFLPEDFIKHIANTHSRKTEHELYKKLHNLYFAPKNFKDSLYPDTLSTLLALKSTHDIGIYSEGHKSFQRKKLIHSNIIEYISPQFIYIARRKTDLETLAKIPQHAIIVDGNLETLKELLKSQRSDLTLIWLNRKDSKKDSHLRTIHSLTELN